MKILDRLDENIFTRSTISELFKEINSLNSNELTLDFDSIKFISRSCADEYIKQKEKSAKKILEVNMSEEVFNMFKNVENQYKTAGVEISFKFSPKQNKVTT